MHLESKKIRHNNVCQMHDLGKEEGRKGKAIDHYERFLNLWKDADFGIPEVADAKNRLSQMQTRQSNKQVPLHNLMKV